MIPLLDTLVSRVFSRMGFPCRLLIKSYRRRNVRFKKENILKKFGKEKILRKYIHYPITLMTKSAENATLLQIQ